MFGRSVWRLQKVRVDSKTLSSSMRTGMVGEEVRVADGFAGALLLPSLETQVQDKDGKGEEEEEAETVMLTVPDVRVKHSYA